MDLNKLEELNKVEEAKSLVRFMSDKEKKRFKNWCLEWDFHLFPPYLSYSKPSFENVTIKPNTNFKVVTKSHKENTLLKMSLKPN